MSLGQLRHRGFCIRPYFTICDGYDICDICGWNRSRVQESDPDSHCGPNGSSLREAQNGWSERNVSGFIREPNASDERDPQWRPLRTDA
jgi:hypothetical protein